MFNKRIKEKIRRLELNVDELQVRNNKPTLELNKKVYYTEDYYGLDGRELRVRDSGVLLELKMKLYDSGNQYRWIGMCMLDGHIVERYAWWLSHEKETINK